MSSADPSLVPLGVHDVEMGRPFPWRVYDETSRLILEAGEAIASADLMELLLACRAKREAVPGPVPGEGAAGRSLRRSSGRRGPGAPAFHDMRLQIGDRLHLELPAQWEARRVIVRLIGYVDGEAVLVTVPSLNGRPVPLLEGERVRVRFFSGLRAYGFESFVDRVCWQGLEYVQLAFPKEIHAVEVRKAPRVRTCIVADVRRPGGAADGPAAPALIVNLSTSGAGLMACREVAGCGDQLELSFALRTENTTTRVGTGAVVHSAGFEPATGKFHFGVQFEGLENVQRLALKVFVLERLYEDPSSHV